MWEGGISSLRLWLLAFSWAGESGRYGLLGGKVFCPRLGTGHMASPLCVGGPVSKEQWCSCSGVEFLGAEKVLLLPSVRLSWPGSWTLRMPVICSPASHLWQVQLQSYLALIMHAQVHVCTHGRVQCIHSQIYYAWPHTLIYAFTHNRILTDTLHSHTLVWIYILRNNVIPL